MILVFLANHCPWVKGMDGDLVKLVDSLEGKDVRVVGVSVNYRQEDRLPAMVKHAGARIMRGGAFKPRTSPYSFQGLGFPGLDLLVEAGHGYG